MNIEEVDVSNKHLVGRRGENVVVTVYQPVMTKQEAAVHAAWLLTLSEVPDHEFMLLLDKVRNT
jgi:hypothetical protein